MILLDLLQADTEADTENVRYVKIASNFYITKDLTILTAYLAS